MDRRETEKLFNLFLVYWPNSEQAKSKTVMAAWALALEPFSYDDVKAATADYAAKNKFFPDVCDITGKLSPNVTAAEPERTPGQSERKRIFAKYARQLSEDEEGRISVSRYAREHGLSWEEARAELIAKGLYTPPA